MNAKTIIFASLLSLHLTACDSSVNTSLEDSSEKIEGLIMAAGEPAEPDTFFVATVSDISFEEIDTFGEAWSCRITEYDRRTAPDEFKVFNPNVDVIWPGSALQGHSIQLATPDPIIAPRGSGTIVIGDINGSDVATVDVSTVTLSTVTEAANTIIKNHPGSFPADLSLTIKRIRSEEELSIEAGANAGFLGLFKSKAKFELSEDLHVKSFLVSLVQPFYSLTFDRPQSISDFWADSVTERDLAPFMGSGNPPVYVSSVTYGRIFYLLIEAVGSDQEIEASLDASFIAGGFGGGINGNVKHVSELDQLKIQVFALGGDQGEVLNAIKGGSPSLDQFLQSIERGNDITLAKPLSYSIRSVGNAKLVKNDIYFKYTVKHCYPLNVQIEIDPDAIQFGSPFREADKVRQFKIVNRSDLAKAKVVFVSPKKSGTTFNFLDFFPSIINLEPHEEALVQVTWSPRCTRGGCTLSTGGSFDVIINDTEHMEIPTSVCRLDTVFGPCR